MPPIRCSATVALDPAQPLDDALAEHDGAYGAALDPTLLARLDLKPGDALHASATRISIVRATLDQRADKLAGGIGFGPRAADQQRRACAPPAWSSPAAWCAGTTALRLPASAASDADVAAVADAARDELPQAGWEIRTRTNASPQLERNVERFTQFLTLVGLTALLVGGVGVANAVKSHLDRKRDVDRHPEGARRDAAAACSRSI